MKRQRGRGGRGKPGGGGGGHHHQNQHQPNRTLESNGPEIKVRGPAAHIYERYLQLARDASSSGDRVMAENYLQHAEHYFRVLRAMQPATPPPQQQHMQNGGDRFGGSDMDYENEEGGAQENQARGNGGGGGGGGNEAESNAGEAADQPDVEFPGAQGQAQQGDGDRNGEFRRGRRGRRNRFRPEGERAESGEGEGERAANSEGGEERPPRREREGGAREGRPPRRERPENSDQDGGAEGFSNGPKPAFLRND